MSILPSVTINASYEKTTIPLENIPVLDVKNRTGGQDILIL